jgi:hypothetical protein
MTWLLIKHGAKSIKSRVGAKQAEQILLGDHAPPEGRPMKNILFSALERGGRGEVRPHCEECCEWRMVVLVHFLGTMAGQQCLE